MKKRTALTPKQQWARTACLVPANTYRSYVLDGLGREAFPKMQQMYGVALRRYLYPVFLGQLKFNTRHFLSGDIVLVKLANGGAERFPVHGYSSRGYEVTNHYLRVRRWNTSGAGGGEKRESGPLELLDHPGELVGLRLTDPAVRAWVEQLDSEGSLLMHQRKSHLQGRCG